MTIPTLVQPMLDTPEKAARDLDLYWHIWRGERRKKDLETWRRASARADKTQCELLEGRHR